MKSRFYACFVLLLVICISICSAKTRWSALHFIPDADLLDDNDIVFDLNSFYLSDSADGSVFKPAGKATYSVIKWVNFEAGYAGGVTLGLKARILDETSIWLPSVAIGVRNCITNQELYYFDRTDKSFTNELYLAIAKSIEPVRLRMHLGIQSIPNNKREAFNPFIGLEKYFGGGVYASLEVYRRDHAWCPSLFTSVRFWKSRFELTAGVVSIAQMLLDNRNHFSTGITSSKNEGILRPGVFVGLRFHGNLGKLGRNDGFTSLDDKVNEQKLMIDTLRYQVDSLKKVFSSGKSQINSIDSSVAALNDSTIKNKDRYRTIAIDKLNAIRVFYSQEPFEPELVKKGVDEIVGYRDEIVPSLFKIVFDLSLDKKLRTIAVTVLGEIATPKALDALIDILSQTKENDVKIEALISLGNNKEARAAYLMRQLVNDPDDALSFTAAEVLKKIELQTGIQYGSPDTVEKIPLTIPEKKISGKNAGSDTTKVNIKSDSDQTKVKPDTLKNPSVAPMPDSTKKMMKNGAKDKNGSKDSTSTNSVNPAPAKNSTEPARKKSP